MGQFSMENPGFLITGICWTEFMSYLALITVLIISGGSLLHREPGSRSLFGCSLSWMKSWSYTIIQRSYSFQDCWSSLFIPRTSLFVCFMHTCILLSSLLKFICIFHLHLIQNSVCPGLDSAYSRKCQQALPLLHSLGSSRALKSLFQGNLRTDVSPLLCSS